MKVVERDWESQAFPAAQWRNSGQQRVTLAL
jgi:hypothetical protein